jgi:flavodoxin
MKALVLYDSTYGNTERIARAIGEALGDGCRVLRASDTSARDLIEAGLLLVGCPTQGGRPTGAVKKLLGGIEARALSGVAAAAFDTRFAPADQGLGLRLLMRVIGYAAPRIASQLEAKGARLVAPPEGFIVEGTEGPLRDGELERARAWAQRVRETIAVPV